jgi:secreted PhoX family phosphatase
MKSDSDDVGVNRMMGPCLPDIADYPSRRQVIRGGLAALLALAGRAAPSAQQVEALTFPSAEVTPSLFTFAGVPTSREDTVAVPAGYSVDVLYAWGDPISDGPTFKPDASNSAVEQERQAGMHHDGLGYFPLPFGSSSSTRGLLAINHEYTDDGLLHPGGMTPWTPEKVAKSQAAHGVSVIEVALVGDRWTVVRPSAIARRVTARTPIRLVGPVAGHPRLRTAADPDGRTVLGTLNNCAHGVTPWGTYLTCEENFNGYFVNPTGDVIGAAESERAQILRDQARYGIARTGLGYRWHEHDDRFDVSRHPNEPNRFGWVVEIDPYDPARPPVKHTALGRFKHEGAWVRLAADGRVVVYMADDERFEYVYKFVSANRYQPGDRAANLRLLEEGTLYAARFDATGSGEWLALTHGTRGLTTAAGFDAQAAVLMNARAAGDRVGATPMDRPEWIAVHPATGEVYVSLTNNSQRGVDPYPRADAANPRAVNTYGHILRWREQRRDAAATRFDWDVFFLCGDPAQSDPDKRGTIRGDAFGSPDGLWFDRRGVLWIQTDASAAVLNREPDYGTLGNNQMLAADPVTGEVRRFLTAPPACEVTGVAQTPDGCTMFVNIQHPGETARERSDPERPTAVSSWPDGPRAGRPRSATIVIRRRDGGVVGT